MERHRSGIRPHKRPAVPERCERAMLLGDSQPSCLLICQFAADAGRWFGENAYAHLQGTRPQTPAYGLNDSPTGLAAWVLGPTGSD
jgi:hypothetical protein